MLRILVLLLILTTSVPAIILAFRWWYTGEENESAIVLLTTFAGLLIFLLGFLHRKQKTQSKEPAHDELANRNRQAMINKVRTTWISGVLNRSLYQEVLIALDLIERPKAVERPMDVLVQRPNQADQALPPGTSSIDVYDDMGKSLLILGDPGSGKTTLLLELTRDLLTRAEENETHPIPVVFPLSTWANQQLPLAEWLVEELRRRYQVGSQLAEQWVKAEQILPLLDGLDEVAEDHRGACLDAINTFRQDHGLFPLVVCSRTGEFEAIGTRLQLDGAIAIQPLTAQQVDNYLDNVGESLASVRQALKDNPNLWRLLDTPLMLSIFTLTYAEQPVVMSM